MHLTLCNFFFIFSCTVLFQLNFSQASSILLKAPHPCFHSKHPLQSTWSCKITSELNRQLKFIPIVVCLSSSFAMILCPFVEPKVQKEVVNIDKWSRNLAFYATPNRSQHVPGRTSSRFQVKDINGSWNTSQRTAPVFRSPQAICSRPCLTKHLK